MRTVNYGISDKSIELISFSRYNSRGSNKGEIAKMKTLLGRAISNELTEKQRECLIMYYYQGKNMVKIAGELNLNKSTVSRHIQKAKQRLKRVADYYVG